MELYMDRSLYTNDDANTDSSIFEEMVENAIENLNGASGSIQNTPLNNVDTYNELDKYDNDKINNAIDYV